ncbi:unnamed protein product, partial [Symbiodinium pilosum]
RALQDLSLSASLPDEAVASSPRPVTGEERRIGLGEMPCDTDLQSFYGQVLPLLQGTLVGALRPPRKSLEERLLVLSSDFQRLELWMQSGADVSDSPIARKRVADAFLRLEMLTRVHLPKATMMALQQKASVSSRSKSRFCFHFEFVIMGSDTWRLATSDVQSLQVILRAVRALLMSRGKLRALAVSRSGASIGRRPRRAKSAV